MIIAVLGKSNSGKTTFVEHMPKAYELTRVITSTSRPMRKGEVNGVHYNFYSYEEMKRDIESGEYLEYTEFNNWIYGTKFKDIDINKNSIIAINPTGYKTLRRIYKDKVLGVYLKPCELSRIIRILKRDKGNYKEAFRRYIADIRDFKNIEADIIIKDFKINKR